MRRLLRSLSFAFRLKLGRLTISISLKSGSTAAKR